MNTDVQTQPTTDHVPHLPVRAHNHNPAGIHNPILRATDVSQLLEPAPGVGTGNDADDGVAEAPETVYRVGAYIVIPKTTAGYIFLNAAGGVVMGLAWWGLVDSIARKLYGTPNDFGQDPMWVERVEWRGQQFAVMRPLGLRWDYYDITAGVCVVRLVELPALAHALAARLTGVRS